MSLARNPFKNLVFGGVGVDGTAYVGAIKQLEREMGSLRVVQRAAGASSGSIIAFLIAMRCTANQIEQYYNHIDFAHVANDNNILSDIYNISVHQSLYNNTHLRSVLVNLFEESIGAIDITFQQLQEKGYKDLTIITTMVCMVDGESSRVLHKFSAEHTPHTQIITAILASVAIPGIFPMITLIEKSPGEWVEDSKGCVHIDGGFVDDLPVAIFDKKKYIDDYAFDEKNDANTLNQTICNPETLAFMVYSHREVLDLESHKKDIQPITHHQFGKIIYGLANGAIFGPQRYLFTRADDAKRTVLIDNLGVSVINFNITAAQKTALETAGIAAVKTFFAAPLASVHAATSGVKLFTPAKPPDPVTSSQKPKTFRPALF
jgi:NTE family protein